MLSRFCVARHFNIPVSSNILIRKILYSERRKLCILPVFYHIARSIMTSKPAPSILKSPSTTSKTSVTTVLIDISGTVLIDDAAIPGAVEAFKRLRDHNLQIKFVTNTTKESNSKLYNRLITLGFDVKEEEVFSSLTAARTLLVEQSLRPLLMISDDAFEDFKDINCCDPNAVVIGLAPDKFNYKGLNEAALLLLSGARLIAIHKSRYFKTKGALALGPGPFVAALEYACGIKAEVVGKPEKRFFMDALKTLGAAPENAVMIGDDAKDDIGGAHECGIYTVLVKTGKYRKGDETKHLPQPHFLADTFVTAVDHILSRIKS